MIEEFNFNCSMDNCLVGWANLEFFVGEFSINFEASYLGGDIFYGIFNAVFELHNYFGGNPTIDYPDFNQMVDWYGEPSQLRLVLFAHDEKTIRLKIYLLEDVDSHPNNFGKLLYEGIISFASLLTRVYEVATKLLKKYGFQGYNEKWLGEFPASNYLRLHNIINNTIDSEYTFKKDLDILNQIVKS